jgi:hypothetical protein
MTQSNTEQIRQRQHFSSQQASHFEHYTNLHNTPGSLGFGQVFLNKEHLKHSTLAQLLSSPIAISQ